MASAHPAPFPMVAETGPIAERRDNAGRRLFPVGGVVWDALSDRLRCPAASHAAGKKDSLDLL